MVQGHDLTQVANKCAGCITYENIVLDPDFAFVQINDYLDFPDDVGFDFVSSDELGDVGFGGLGVGFFARSAARCFSTIASFRTFSARALAIS